MGWLFYMTTRKDGEFMADGLKTGGIMKDETGKIVFDAEEQAKVDEIVKERLARVEKKPEDYEDLKEIEKILEEFNYTGSPAEKKEALKAYRESMKQQQELDKLNEMAEEDGLTPALAKKIKSLEDTIGALNGTIKEITEERNSKKQADEQKKKQEENFKTQIAEFKTEYSDIDLEVLEKDDDFIEYASGRNGTLKTLYEGYVKFTSKLKEKTADEITAKFKVKELSSTGTGKGKIEAGEYGLTERQKTLAKANGISYKDYAELLKYSE